MAGSRLLHLLIVISIWAAIYLPSLGVPQVAFDEHKRILPAMTMLETGDWAQPELAGRKYFNKPPLINWMIAASFIAAGGQSDFAARLPSAVSILLFCVLVLFLKSSFLTPQGRFISALIFLTSFSLIFKGRLAEIDASYTCLTGAAIYIWANAMHDGIARVAWTVPFAILGLGLLLKGPMILLFFYAVAIPVLLSLGRKRDLYRFPHLAGLALMLAIFFAWFVFGYEKIENPGAGEKTSTVAAWIHELTLRFRDNLNPLKWIGRVMSAIGGFMPWLVFVPFLWSREWTGALDEKDRKFFRACRFGVVLGFALVCLMPGTRPRYSMPAFAFLSILLGWLMSCQKDRVGVEKIWRMVLLGLFPAIVVAMDLCGALIITGRFVEFPSKLAEMLAPFRSPLQLSLLIFAIMAANFAFFIFLAKRRAIAGFERLMLHSSILAACTVLFYSTVLVPAIYRNPEFRLAGKYINENTAAGDEIWAFKVTSENFLVYVRRPVKHIYKLHHLPDNARYFILEKSEYDENGAYPFFTDRAPDHLGLIRSGKREFVFLRLNKDYSRPAGK